MLILISLANGQVLAPGVKASIAMHTIPTQIILCCTPGVVNSQRVYTPERKVGEAASRELCKKTALETTDKMFVMMDRDAKLLYPTSLQQALNLLNANHEYGALSLALPKKPWNDYDHIDTRCVMIRREVLEKIDFTALNQQRCICREFTKAIRGLGVKYDYFSNDLLVEEINL
jgi:hypothetical protein